MSNPSTARRPRKLRDANPAAVPNILAGLNASISQWNADAWRAFTQSPETEFVFDPGTDDRLPRITLTRGAVEVRITLAAGFDIHRVNGTILTPAVMKQIEPAQVVRVQWRQALKGGGYVRYS